MRKLLSKMCVMILVGMPLLACQNTEASLEISMGGCSAPGQSCGAGFLCTPTASGLYECQPNTSDVDGAIGDGEIMTNDSSIAEVVTCDGLQNGDVLVEGVFGACDFASDCIESGERTRVNSVCRDGVAVDESQSESCARETDGIVISEGDYDACSFSDDCVESGEQARVNSVCRDGIAVEESQTEFCERDTDGIILSEGEYDACIFRDVCAEAGEQARVNSVCRDGVAVDEAQTQVCERETDGVVLSEGEYAACNFTDECVESGEQTRVNSVCRDGLAVAESQTQVCERDTDGDVLVDSGFSDCSFSGPCVEVGEASRTKTICVDGMRTVEATTQVCERDTEGEIVYGEFDECSGFGDLCDRVGEQKRVNSVCREGAAVMLDEQETRSCERADPGAVINGNRVAACVTDAGGVLELPGGRLFVPANALLEPTEVYLERVDDTPLALDGLTVLGPVFQSGPIETVLNSPVTISANFDGVRDDAAMFVDEQPNYLRVGGRVLADEVEAEVQKFGTFFVADGVDYTLGGDRDCVQLRTVESRVQEPSVVSILVTADDCTGRPLTDLTQADFEILESGTPLHADTVRRKLSTDSVQIFVSLVLDLSDGGRAHLDEIIAGASSLIRLLNEERGLDVQISIEVFGGDQQITRWQAPNLEADILLERLASIGDYAPTIQNTSNLNGAIIQGLQRLSNDTANFRSRNRGGAFTIEHLVVFTAGTDTADYENADAVGASMDTTAAEVSVIGLDAPDFDADALRTLFNDVVIAPDADHLNREFKTVAAQIARKLRRSYILAYCTGQQSGEHTVSVRLTDAENRGVSQMSFLADDIAVPGCSDAFFDTLCDGKECGGLGCGFCDDRIAECGATDQCQSFCEIAPVTADISIADRCDYPNPRGYPQFCEQDISTLCGETCTDLANDPGNCGGCGFDCGFNVTGIVDGERTVGESCQNNTCQCAPGWYGESCDQTQCGDGFVTPDEVCDDGNADNFDGCSDTCELETTWVQVASLPSSFSQTHHSFGFSFGGLGYLTTGSSSTGIRDDFYQYDPINDTWTELDPFPGVARSCAIGDTWNGKAYFGFGSDSTSYLNDFWVFNPEDMSWTELAPCPCLGRRHPAMIAQNGSVLVGLGNGSEGNMNDWWAYEIASNTWSQKTDFPSSPRHHPYQFGIGDYAYTGLGHGNGIFNEWYRYEIATDTWTEVATLPGEGRVAGTQFSYDGIGYVLSGDGDDHRSMETGEFWAYDPILDTWEERPPHPEGSRWAPASFIIDGEVYLINGTSFGQYVSEVYKFDLISEP